MDKDLSTEQNILKAAREVFMAKGMEGARMQEIADRAGINKAMLHYYFRSKDKLFEAIFQEALMTIFPKINEILATDIPLFDKIRMFVSSYIDLMMQNPYLPAFVVYEINRDPDWVPRFINALPNKPNPIIMAGQAMKEIQEGIIRPFNPMQLLVNVVSLSIFPFIARPIVKVIFQMDDDTYARFMEERKKDTAEFIINAIKAR